MIVDGIAFALQTLVHRTKGKGSGLWPSPRTRGLLGGSGSREMIQAMVKKGELSQTEAEMMLQVKLWPTPKAQDWGGSTRAGTPGSRPNKKGGRILAEEAKKAELWSTPIASDATMNYQSEKALAKGWKPQLTQQAMNWPTPHAGTREGQSSGGHAGLASSAAMRKKLKDMAGEEGKKMATQALNPDWVEWLMGFPTGWTSLEPLIGNLEYGTPEQWLTDPADEGIIPRISTGVDNRVNRLKGLGNAQVPLVVATAWRLLTKENK